MDYCTKMLSDKINQQAKEIAQLEKELEKTRKQFYDQIMLSRSLERQINCEVADVCSKIVNKSTTVEELKDSKSLVLICLFSKFKIKPKCN